MSVSYRLACVYMFVCVSVYVCVCVWYFDDSTVSALHMFNL